MMCYTHPLLTPWLQDHVDSSYPLHSRVHPLKTFPQGAQWFVKREDELSFGISGSKYRKYASLIPYLKKQGYQTIHIVGSMHSNHLVSLLQLLNENALTPVVYVLGSPGQAREGNYGFMRLLLGRHALHFFSKEEWPSREKLIQNTLSTSCIYIPEGADFFPSLPGALTLPLNILHNQMTLSLSFDHIFIDAGTGLSAIALLLGMALLPLSATVHVVLMADTPALFEAKLFSYQNQLEKTLSCTLVLPKYHLYPSAIAPSFGSTNKKVLDEACYLAEKEGLLCDLLYNAKLFYTAKMVQQTHALGGKILCIHSGGGLSLCGFPKLFL